MAFLVQQLFECAKQTNVKKKTAINIMKVMNASNFLTKHFCNNSKFEEKIYNESMPFMKCLR